MPWSKIWKWGPRVSAAEEMDLVPFDFSSVPGLVALVRPLAGLNPSFDVDLPALRQILLTDFSLPPKYDNAMPFRAFLFLAGLVGPALMGRYIEISDGLAKLLTSDGKVAFAH